MTAYRPTQVDQLDGSRFASVNCNCAVAAMALDRETLGKKTTTGAKVRAWTGDTSGGTTQRQAANAIAQGWQEYLDVETPIASSTALRRLDEGQGMMLGGQSGATRGTRWQASETFTGNHQWFDNERRKNSQVAGGYEHYIYDPLADGRRPSIAQSPFWVPENLVLDFARRLDLDGHGHPLGYGKFYAVFTHDTEPHLVLRYGATEVKPMVVATIRVAAGQKANCRSGPGLHHKIIDRYANGAKFTQRQKVTTTGAASTLPGLWYGNIDGTRWLHVSAF